jgi:hypothetical protein
VRSRCGRQAAERRCLASSHDSCWTKRVVEHQSGSDSCPSQRWCGSALGKRERTDEHKQKAGVMVGEQSEMGLAAEVRMRSRWSSSLARCTGSHGLSCMPAQACPGAEN